MRCRQYDPLRRGKYLSQKLEPLDHRRAHAVRNAGRVAARPGVILDKAFHDRIANVGKDNRNGPGRGQDSFRRRAADHEDSIRLRRRKFARLPYVSFAIPANGTRSDVQIAAFDKSVRGELVAHELFHARPKIDSIGGATIVRQEQAYPA